MDMPIILVLCAVILIMAIAYFEHRKARQTMTKAEREAEEKQITEDSRIW